MSSMEERPSLRAFFNANLNPLSVHDAQMRDNSLGLKDSIFEKCPCLCAPSPQDEPLSQGSVRDEGSGHSGSAEK